MLNQSISLYLVIKKSIAKLSTFLFYNLYKYMDHNIFY